MNLQIYETFDYSIFKRLPGNRDVKCVKRIIESINNIGYVLSPIMVNSKYEIIDGQNRVEALETLGLPVHYYIEENATIDHARWLNIGRTNWNVMDYCKSFAEGGNQNYCRLLKLYDDYGTKQITFQVVWGIAMNNILTGGGMASRIMSMGDFVLSEDDFVKAGDKLQMLQQIGESADRMEGSTRLVLSGIAWAIDLDGVDKTRLLKTINEKYPMFRPVVSANTFFDDLEEFYNKGIKKKIYFTTEYKKRKEKHK